MGLRFALKHRTVAIIAAVVVVAGAPGAAYAHSTTHSTAHTHHITVTHSHSHALAAGHTHKFTVTDPTKPVLLPTLHYRDMYTLLAKTDFLAGDRKNADGTYNVAVEIPAGTSQKWETSQTVTTSMFWEFKNGAPRIVTYLPYVGNYGSLRNTMAADGDPLDVLVLGPAIPRGTIQKVKIIGVMNILDGTDADDKLLAVVTGDPMGAVNSLAELDATYPGVSAIVKTWFENYKGPGEMTFESWGDVTAAKALADSVPAFR
ncbi:MAG TPA: inorganic diphosphatase [Coriobacteriia bacterium]